MEPPEWAGDAPTCEHGQTRRYKPVTTKDGRVSHIWECTAVQYPDPAQCAAVYINKPKASK